MQQPSRKHHYIPIFWTRQWSGADGCVERFTRHRSVVDKRVPPARVGWAQDLYSVPGVAPDRAQILEEQYFKQLDDWSAIALRKMVSIPPVPLNEHDVSVWTTFILALLHRTPENLRATKLAGREVWANGVPELRERYLELRKPGDPDTIEDYFAMRGSEESERSLLMTLPQLISNPTLGEHIVSMHWVYIDVPFGQLGLLLSDDPLARTNGILAPGGHFAMPLSPRRLLVIAPERSTIERFNRTPIGQLVRSVNRCTVESARRFVVAQSLAQADYIRASFGRDPKPAFNSNIGAAIRAAAAAG